MARVKELVVDLCEWTKSVATDHKHFDVVALFLLIAEFIILTCIIVFIPCELASPCFVASEFSSTNLICRH